MNWSEKEIEAIKLEGVTFEFIGTPRGASQNVPEFVEYYLAGAYGRLAKFKRSALKVGQRFTYEGRDFIVTYNEISKGNIYVPTLHRFAAVPA